MHAYKHTSPSVLLTGSRPCVRLSFAFFYVHSPVSIRSYPRLRPLLPILPPSLPSSSPVHHPPTPPLSFSCARRHSSRNKAGRICVSARLCARPSLRLTRRAQGGVHSFFSFCFPVFSRFFLSSCAPSPPLHRSAALALLPSSAPSCLPLSQIYALPFLPPLSAPHPCVCVCVCFLCSRTLTRVLRLPELWVFVVRASPASF